MNAEAVQYSPLLQAERSDEEEVEDDLELVRGFTSSDLAFPGSRPERRPQPRSASGSRPAGASDPRWSKERKRLVLVVSVACVLVIGVLAAVGMTFPAHRFDAGIVHDTHLESRGGDWRVSFNTSDSEFGVTMVDVDGDGLDDVLLGRFKTDVMDKLFIGHSIKESCISLGLQYPCLAEVVALRGYDGKELWRTPIRNSVIFVNCDNIDVNGDNSPDCIFSGRETTLQAVELRTGRIHWAIDAENDTWSGHFVLNWLVTRAHVIADIDGDGIKDMLVTHGGNGSKAPTDHDRAAGRVIFISGQSGLPLGRYLELPNNRETYMSAVSYVTANGSTYFLLGSGGETVSGDLMIISYSDLVDYIMGNKTSRLRTIYSGQKKGVMIAPVLADSTLDGNLDILMSAFDGTVAMYDGETLQELWSRQFPDLESYSIPAPGRFDDDMVPDFMMMWGKGAWPVYDYAIVCIVSGSDGSVLWQGESEMVPMYSGLTLRTRGTHDLFIMQTFNLQPAPSGPKADPSSHGQPKKRHGEHHEKEEDDENMFKYPDPDFCDRARRDYEQYHQTCSMDLSQLKVQIVLVDEARRDSPQAVYTVSPSRHYYTLPITGAGQHCHQLSPTNKTLLDMCVVSKPHGITGAVGDVDGDGEVDLIHLEKFSANMIDDMYGSNSVFSDIVLSRLSLASVFKGKTELLPMKAQPWRQFMGTSGDSVYTVPR